MVSDTCKMTHPQHEIGRYFRKVGRIALVIDLLVALRSVKQTCKSGSIPAIFYLVASKVNIVNGVFPTFLAILMSI